MLKCAQLPVHGWLIQVMEAPTPVSALLHAGVVNLGGFLLIRLGTLVADVPAAQALLVVVGSVTAVVAALVMMTRISIKVSLAWSTCAQMGFMLMQCGLGLHDLALLHLVAHSLYKAHAFLGAGGAVEQNRLQQMTPPLPPLAAGAWLLGSAGSAWCWWPRRHWRGASAAAQSPALLGARRHRRAGAGAAARRPGGTCRPARAARWPGWPLRLPWPWSTSGCTPAFTRWLGDAQVGARAVDGAGGVGAGMLRPAVRAAGRGARPARWRAGACASTPGCSRGLYLDELFTRLTFRLWPARLPPVSAAVDVGQHRKYRPPPRTGVL